MATKWDDAIKAKIEDRLTDPDIIRDGIGELAGDIAEASDEWDDDVCDWIYERANELLDSARVVVTFDD